MTQTVAFAHNKLAVIDQDFVGKDILSIDQFTPAGLYKLFRLTTEMKRIVVEKESSQILSGMLVSLLFFEASSRTFGSFAAAVKFLGGQTLEIQNPQTVTSVSKGESFEDTIRVFEAYSDAIVLRHPIPGSAQAAADTAHVVPVINAGDGNNEHPTQTLLDLYTLYEKFGRLSHLKGLLVGDALNSRTIHSLIRGLSLFEQNELYVLAAPQLRLPQDELVHLRGRGVKIVEISSEEEIPYDCDFWYWTRVQKERLNAATDAQALVSANLMATPRLLQTYANQNMILMDPLPRVSSVDPAVDADERAVYLRSQIRNGLYTRMALLALILGRA